MIISWHKAGGESEVREQVDFDSTFCPALFDVLGVKKGIKSQSAEILRTVFLTISGVENVVRLQDFGRVCGLLGPINSSFLKRLKAVSKHSWFFGGCSTTQAEKILLASGNKTFLVRFSSTGHNFTLSYVSGNKIWHSRIKKAEGVDSYELEGSNMVFESLEALVNFAVKTKSDVLACAATGSPFVLSWQKKKNGVGGYREFQAEQKK